MDGLTRRAQVDDRLSGASDIQPVTLSAGGVRSPGPAPQARTDQYTSKVLGQLSGYLDTTLNTAAQKQQERSLLEGQVAYHQGESFDAVQMQGDKWALEGYRTVQAQTLSSGLMQAQLEEIETSTHSMDPDAFRDQYLDRVSGMMQGVTDERTLEMMSRQINKQLPEVVSAHTAAHVKWQEQQNFEALEQAIDVVSRDVTSADELLAFVQSSPATSGLSPERKSAAMVSGVIRALDNGNFKAYALLSQEGILGDNLSTSHQNAVRTAKSRYESRVRSEYDADMFAARARLQEEVANGQKDPSAAIEELSLLMADKNLTMNAMEAGEIYSAAKAGVRTAALTRANLIKDAGARGDFGMQSKMMNEALTAGGFRPLGGNLEEALAQYGGDSQRALVALAWSPAAAQDWNGNLNSLPGDVRDLVSKLDQQVTGEAVFTPGQRLQASQNALTATRKRVAMEKYEQMQPQLSRLNQMLKHKEIDMATWRAKSRALYREYGVARNKAAVDSEIAVGVAVEDRIMKEYEEAQEMAKLEAAMPALTQADIAFKTHGSISKLTADRRRIMQAVGLKVTKSDLTTERGLTLAKDSETRRLQEKAQDAAVRAREKAIAKRDAVLAARQKRMEAEQNEASKYMHGLTLRAGAANLEKVAEAYANGEVSASELRATRDAYFKNVQSSATAMGIPFKADTALKDVDRVAQTMTKAVDSHIKYQEEEVLISEAIGSRTLDQLPQALQDRAINDWKTKQDRDIADLVAAGRMDPNAVDQYEYNDVAFAAQNGIATERTKRVVAGYLSQSWLQPDGKPATSALAALGMVDAAVQANPNILPTLIPEAQLRDKVQVALLRREQAGGDWATAITTMEGTNPRGNRLEELQSERVQNKLAEIADAPGVFDRTYWNRTGSQLADMEEGSLTHTSIQNAVKAEAERVIMSNTGIISSTEALQIARKNIESSTALIGGDFIQFPNGQSVPEAFFGPRAKDVDVTDAVNDVVIDILKQDDIQAANPILSRTSSWRDWWENDIPLDEQITGGVGVRPFQTHPYPMPNGKMGLAVYVMRVAPPREGIVDYFFGDEIDPGYYEPIIITPQQMREGGNRYFDNYAR